jgi:hypothetical protein
MTTIIITKHFQKDLDKIKSITIHDIVGEIKKYKKGLNNLIELYSPAPHSSILKGYLNRKKIRVIMLLKIKEDMFAPILIEKKESKYGYNLSKETAMEIIEQKSINILNDIYEHNFTKTIF